VKLEELDQLKKAMISSGIEAFLVGINAIDVTPCSLKIGAVVPK
jgi:hypothetical protein